MSEVLHCPHHKKCGGCNHIEEDYQKTLMKKTAYCRELLVGFGKVHPILGMNYPYYYRHKVSSVIAFDRKKHKTVCGNYQEKSHRVVAIDTCLIEERGAQEIIRDVVSLMPSLKIRSYDEDTGNGLLRHILVRKGYATGEYMLILVAASPVFPAKKRLVSQIRKLHPEISTIVLNINQRTDSMVLGERNETLYGPGYLKDKVLGKTFRISPSAFYQVNPLQMKKLYQYALDAAKLTGKETVIDAYCGTGTIGLCAADQAKRVIGVELNRDAVSDAIKNTRDNAVDNARFIAGDAGDYMVSMLREGKAPKDCVVIMDPPRAGSTPKFLKSLLDFKPKRIVYVSCNPETLARDLKTLTKLYRVAAIRPVDMFPFTDGVECVTELIRKG
ncbi:MAG: 23S rRNA (uracil(1939)-C(5))-methyltransferase RlmD [Lachnospiraceae bacterium]|nr:23S rRNA (uracil(1939)-C(5))-methyltransferase RlmD [Lachnospiraceae bacterium]